MTEHDQPDQWSGMEFDGRRHGPVVQERRLVTEIPGPRSRDLHARKAAAVPAGAAVMIPAYVERAAGGIIVDVDGNQLIDFGSGAGVMTVGHGAERVRRNVRAQAEDFMHTNFMLSPYEEYLGVCEKLNELTPGDHDKRSMLFNSGAEAVENAVKVARAFTGRSAIVAFDNAYHGRTNLTLALTAKYMPFRHSFGPFAGDIYRAPMAYPYRWPGGAADCADQAFDAFVTLLQAQAGIPNTAAVLIEPIQGEGGFVVPPPGWLPRIADYCRQHDILLIADEIQSGFCRTGDWFACDHEGVVPDLIVTAKGLAGGLPLSAVTGRADAMNAVHRGGMGGTYSGNPVACAAALGAIETMQVENLTERAQDIQALMWPRLEKLQSRFGAIGDIRGRGAMLAIELVQGNGDHTPNRALAEAASAACHRNGLVTLTCGTFGNVIRFLPPLSCPDALLVLGLDILEEALASLTEHPPDVIAFGPECSD